MMNPSIHGNIPFDCLHSPIETAFHSSIATRAEDAQRCAKLVHARYSLRGYDLKMPSATDPARRFGEATLMAESYETRSLLGTLTVRCDPLGPTPWLHLDASFHDEACELRHRGAKLCEITRLAFEPASSQSALGSLFHGSLLFAQAFDCTHLLMEVNPRHETVYRRGLGFERIASCPSCPRVNAPAVLLAQSIEEIIKKSTLPTHRRSNTFYDRFMSPDRQAFARDAFSSFANESKQRAATAHGGASR